jgi:hypothetical protein
MTGIEIHHKPTRGRAGMIGDRRVEADVRVGPIDRWSSIRLRWTFGEARFRAACEPERGDGLPRSIEDGDSRHLRIVEERAENLAEVPHRTDVFGERGISSRSVSHQGVHGREPGQQIGTPAPIGEPALDRMSPRRTEIVEA